LAGYTQEKWGTVHKVLIANRGEIAVRVARACRDAGLASVAVYADPDRDAPHVQLCDEAFALGGDTAMSSYLDAGKILAAARRCCADAIHPGYGFLSENAEFAQAVLDAGMVWIGPPPSAIRVLGDKVVARQLARRVGAPLMAGTSAPVADAEEIVAFATEHGIPLVIKAAFGGGGRGLKVVHSIAAISELYGSAVREATAAFGRGECFLERYLDRARHVETQCLADAHGTVVVLSTRDCSLQRRHQKLVEEAPAPFLTAEQDATLYAASKAILQEAGYVGAGTCEFLIGSDGTVSFLEVNTRLQVEHPVTEEVTGIDLVREMLRIADDQPLGYQDPPARGHSVEFRINGEDPGRNFLPTPGTVRRWRTPGGPGVRLDSGVEEGSVVGQAFDSLLAKLIITGHDRRQALQRARRALSEFEVEGIATVLPFHRAVVEDPAFTAEHGRLSVHTRWIETEFTNTIPPHSHDLTVETTPPRGHTVVVEVDGRRVEIVVPTTIGIAAATSASGPPKRPPQSRRGVGAAGKDALLAPMQGTVVKLVVAEGDHVVAGQPIAFLEAMKMEQPIKAHKDGTVRELTVTVGATVSAGSVLCLLAD
jgi:acetyl-CoA/propionyl-CoA carboxylase biotin carboxyl carrier protein